MRLREKPFPNSQMSSVIRASLPVRFSPVSAGLQRSSVLQGFFHPGPTLSRGFLRCVRAAPVGLETYGEMIAVALQRLKLPDPIDDTAAHRRPLVALAVRFFCRILAMTVANAILRQEIVSIWVGLLILLRCVSWVPIQH